MKRRWPGSSKRSLGRQVREAAQSIPANIAEGCGRDSSRDMARFLQMAIGSSTELEYHLQFAGESGTIHDRESRDRQDRVIEIRKMLIGLQRSVKSRITKGRPFSTQPSNAPLPTSVPQHSPLKRTTPHFSANRSGEW
jgi:four helix bundle protein